MKYDRELPSYGELMSVEKFVEYCEDLMFIDEDGMGSPVKDNMMAGGFDNYVYPSELHNIPEDATHIMWFNK